MMGGEDQRDHRRIMPTPQQHALDVLAQLHIAYDRYDHPAAATVADAELYWSQIDAAHCKNLFLRNQKGDRHYLVILSAGKRADLRRVADQIGDGKVSFASPERLQKYLGVTPGSVSPFGLIHDVSRHVRVFIDQDLDHAGRISFHPNDNTATLVLSLADFKRFLAHVGHVVRPIVV
jgi:Ala-tRNA(Pro) deacylase